MHMSRVGMKGTVCSAWFRLAPVLAALAGAACPSKEPELKEKACCEQPEIPAGVTPFRVVRDDVTGRSDEQKVIMRVGLTQPIKRDAVYPVLHHLYRYAHKRGPLEPIQVDVSIYPDVASAEAGGDVKVLATITRAPSELGPRCDNRVPYDLSEQVDRAFYSRPGDAGDEKIDDTCRLNKGKPIPRVDEAFTHKPGYKLDTNRRAVDVTYPYLAMGKDEWDKSLSFSAAVMAWSEVAARLFENVPDLREMNFTGLLEDAPVLKIALTRPQYDGINRGLRETIAAHRGITFQSVGMKRMNDQQAAKEEQTFRTKTYREALAKLPKAQVTVSPKLK
jgi:hypothetical protein